MSKAFESLAISTNDSVLKGITAGVKSVMKNIHDKENLEEITQLAEDIFSHTRITLIEVTEAKAAGILIFRFVDTESNTGDGIDFNTETRIVMRGDELLKAKRYENDRWIGF